MTMHLDIADQAIAYDLVGEGPLVLELSTTGGDADVGRRIADDVRLFRRQTGRKALFLGRATVYSAGVTIMAGFAAPDRWLSVGTSLMIHGRKLSKCLNMDGPLRSERAICCRCSSNIASAWRSAPR